jgi:hypothetical protein
LQLNLLQDETVIGQTRKITLTVLSLSLLLLDFGWVAAAEPKADYQPTDVRNLDQGWMPGWEAGQSNWFHHASQGTMMLPYDWFMALEQPTTDPAMPDSGLFSDPNYLSQFGFIRSKRDPHYNPGNLPIGFAIADNWVDPNTPNERPFKALGLSCAACHTSQITYQGTRLRIDGGSAMIEIGAFQKKLGLALIITNSSTKKFDRFADRIISSVAMLALLDAETRVVEETKIRAVVKDKLEQAVLKALQQQRLESQLQLRTVDAGFGRTDALTLIGNRVFGRLGPVNLTKANAPVNYPQLWDTPWFYWVQYNASIRPPMVRNIGEALGVGAAMNSEFESTVDIENLHLMEDQVAGKQPLSGLKAPAWPSKLFGKINGFKDGTGKWKKGKTLYKKLCIHCHYLIEDYEAALSLDLDDDCFRTHWSQPNRFGRSYMKLPYINYVDIGTDPAAVLDFNQRIVYTGALDIGRSTMPAGEALALTTAKVREREYANLGLSPAQYAAYDGYRELNGEPPAIARLDYKARPLNGVWATAPFLHNGSVPNLYELLSPASERSSTFYVGSTEYDPKHVGFTTAPKPGHFQVNTHLPGNLNTGHEFRNLTKEEEARLTPYQKAQRKKGGWAVFGVIADELKPGERWALIEYVKSLGSTRPKTQTALEKIPPEEPEFIMKLAGALAHDQRKTKIKSEHRGQHPKNHGAVWARFRVTDDLPNRLKVGIFRQPNDFSCVIRFSNGQESDDQQPDAHGMAIKLIKRDPSDLAKTETQDFVLADNPVFFAKDVKHLFDFFVAIGKANDDKQLKKKIVMGLIRDKKYPALVGFTKPLKTSPLQATYWSQTPYNLGGSAVKYVVVPREDNGRPALSAAKNPANALREAMVQRLTIQTRPAVFDFCIQEQTDPDKMPVENPTVEWKSRPIKVATITIYPQKFDSKAQMTFCENLAFTPWRAPEEHRPLGGINRARKSIYDASRQLRHETNKVDYKEPTGRETF